MTLLQIRLVIAAAVACLVAAPFVLNPFSITLLNYIGIYSLAAIGLALLTGVGGIVSFGQAAFVGVAAYATAWATARERLLALARAGAGRGSDLQHRRRSSAS